MTSVETNTGETPLYTHSCACCGEPIAARHEIICEAIIAVNAFVTELDVDGNFTTIYCPACLIDVLELTETMTEGQIGAILKLSYWL